MNGNPGLGNVPWNNTHKKHLQQVVKIITHKSVVESQDSLVFVVCMSSNSEAKKVKSFVKDLSETVGGIKQMSFFYKDETHFDVVRDGLLYDCESAPETRKMQNDIANRSLKIEWSQLKTYVEAKKIIIWENLKTSSLSPAWKKSHMER